MPFDPVDRVRKLRAQADSTTFPAEAEQCRSRALKIMAEHQLTENHINPPPLAPPDIMRFMWGPMGNGFPTGVPTQVRVVFNINDRAGFVDEETIRRAFEEGMQHMNQNIHVRFGG